MMSTKKIITISRQLASGGRHIGKKLAEDLGIPFYDKELLALAAKESGLSEEAFENADEQPTNSFLYNLSVNSQMLTGSYNDYSSILSNDRLFVIQSEVIRSVAAKGPCVIVGRCADYILSDNPDLVSVFLYASPEYRAERIVEYEKIQKNKAQSYIAKADKKRGNYYNYYTGRRWAEASSYDLCLDAGKLGIDKSAEAIKAYLKIIEE